MPRALPLLSTILALAGCASLEIGKPADWPKGPEAQRACAESPYSQAVLTNIRERMLHHWQLPDGVRADERVVLGIILDSDGRVARSAVFEASNRGLAHSALRALRDAEPYAIPPDAACLVGLPILGTFTNPAVR